MTTVVRMCLVAVSALTVVSMTGCEPGPAERTGEKIDRALDRLSGKGPAQKAGEKLDRAVDELKK